MNWKDFAKKNSDWIRYINVDSFNQIIFTTKGKHYEELFLIDDDVFHLLNLSELDDNKQRKIIDFVSQDPKKWYEEPLFYIVLGRGTYSGLFTAYKKIMFNQYEIVDEADINGDDRCDYVFTQDEIDDLKAKLPENMKKIVDLGKTEVNGNDN